MSGERGESRAGVERNERESGGEGEPRARGLLQGAAALILRELALGQRSVTELVAATGLSQPNVSNHLARLRVRGMVRSERRGRSIVYRLASAGLGRLLVTQPGPAPPGGISRERAAADFLAAVLELREDLAGQVLDTALAAGMEWKELYLHVLTPTLVEVGRRWEQRALTVGGEHTITGIVLRLLHRLSLALPLAPPAGAPSAVIGCVEGEAHTVGGRMVADFLAAQGWRTWFLNGNLPKQALLEAVRHYSPDAVVLSITMPEHAPALRRTVRSLLRLRGERALPLAVAGGRYFADSTGPVGCDLAGTDIEVITAEMRRRVGAVRVLPPVPAD